MKVSIKAHTSEGIRTIEAEIGETLLSALTREGLILSAPCGGRGRCGKCILRAVGSFENEPSEFAGVIPEGSVLACHTRVTGDSEVWLTETENRILSAGTGRETVSDGEEGLGVAVDIGTTTVAAYLVNLQNGETLACETMLNPQRGHGADVISRLSFAMEKTDNALLCQNEILTAIREMTRKMLEKSGNAGKEIKMVSCVGNTVMMHLLGGYPVDSLALAPFTPFYTEPHEKTLNGMKTYLGGCISGYVGADTVGAALACDLDITDETALLIDIGTNGEIVLRHEGKFVCCSCAAGPAFEGAHIACGTGAVTGAIDHVKNENGTLTYSTIGNSEAVGICGSGLIDLVAALVDEEEISPAGRMSADYRLNDRVYLARGDVREVQLAKAAIAAGIQILLDEMGISGEDVRKVYVAGGFGNFINMENACKIGMLPMEFLPRIECVGNAAGDGARRMLLSANMRERAKEFRNRARYVELAAQPDFNDLYAENLLFSEEE